MRHLAIVTALLMSSAAYAADNAVIVTPGVGVTIRSIDVGSLVQAPAHAIVDASGAQLGVVGAPLYTRVASGFIASGAIASGAFASGSVSSGAFASGALASGSIAAGAQVDLLTMRGTVAAGTAASNSMLVGGVYNSSPITLTTGQQSAMQFDVNGYLKVNTAAGGATGSTSNASDAVATSSTNTPTVAFGYGFNGTTWDRMRTGAIANVAAATGFANLLPAAQYNATPVTVTDTRYQSLQSDVNGYLKVNVTNANTNGAKTSAASSPVVLPTDTAAIPLWGHGATAAAVPANAVYQGVNVGGNLVGVIGDPCQTVAKINLPISQATSTQIIAGTSAKKTYICSMALIAAAAEVVNIIAGTGSVCATGGSAVMGSTTAANGLSLAANGGLTFGSGVASVAAATNANADNVCLTQAGSVRVSGVITYVQQ